jgi:hypothetical protein
MNSLRLARWLYIHHQPSELMWVSNYDWTGTLFVREPLSGAILGGTNFTIWLAQQQISFLKDSFGSPF